MKNGELSLGSHSDSFAQPASMQALVRNHLAAPPAAMRAKIQWLPRPSKLDHQPKRNLSDSIE